MMLQRFFVPLRRDASGTMAIETALIAPLLAGLALGAFDVSMLVSREQQLQSAANEASEIILAASGGSGIANTDLETILETSLDLDPGQVTIAPRYRCSTGNISSTVPTCGTGQQIYTYVHLTVTGSYTPVWTSFGVGSTINYNIQRTVQIS